MRNWRRRRCWPRRPISADTASSPPPATTSCSPERRPALLLVADREGRQGGRPEGRRQHRIRTGIGRDHLGAVLDISRLDAGAMKPDETAFSLDGLLRQIGKDFRPLAAEKKLELTIMASSLAVMTDRNLLRRLIQNLVSNAIKYTRTGRILVGVRRRGDLAEIQVIDTGIGIAGDKLNTVFREFTRLDEGAREAEGLGLGLSIVDRIARVLRLEIRIFSNPARARASRSSCRWPAEAEPRPRDRERTSARELFACRADSASASTMTRASSTACGCCSKAGAVGSTRVRAQGIFDAARRGPARHHPRRLSPRRRNRSRRDQKLRAAHGSDPRACWSPPTVRTRCGPQRAARRTGDQQAAETGGAALDDGQGQTAGMAAE